MEKGKHNSGNSLIHSWHLRVSQGFLVGKTNGGILRFLMQRSKSIYWKASPSYVFFPLDQASGKGKVQFLLHILCFSSLRFPTENKISLFKPLGEKWPKNISIHLLNKCSLHIICVSQTVLKLRIQ